LARKTQDGHPKRTKRGAQTRLRPRPAGLPDEARVVAETSFASPKGTRYRILKTTETDAYDRPSGSTRKPR